MPRGPRRRREDGEARLLACPKLDPTWELSAIGSLMKPNPATGGPVRHREPEQPWTDDDAEAARRVVADAAAALSVELGVADDALGDFHFLVNLNGGEPTTARGVALALSTARPDHWFRLDRLYVRQRQFFRRKNHYKLELTRASEATVPREVRAALRHLL